MQISERATYFTHTIASNYVYFPTYFSVAIHSQVPGGGYDPTIISQMGFSKQITRVQTPEYPTVRLQRVGMGKARKK